MTGHERTLSPLPDRPSVLAGVRHLLLTHHTARRGAAVVGLVTIAAKGVGFVRELLVAWLFGASAAVDAYRVGETLSGIASGLARQGFDMAGVPLLVERRLRDGDAAEHRLRGDLLTLALLLSAAVAIAAFFLAPALVRLLAPRLSPDTGRLAVTIARIMAPTIVAIAVADAAGAWYNARRRFAIPRLFDPAVSLVAIACLLLLARRLGIVGLAAGWTLGHVAALAVVLLPLVRAGRRLLTRLSDAGTGRFLRLAAPAMLLAAVQPLNIAIGRAFASSLPAGSIAMLGYADRLFMLPTYILLASLTPVLLTKSSELSAAGRTVELRRHFSRLLAVLALTLIPVTLALVPLSEPLVRLIYQRGAFTAAAAQATARALACFGLGLFPAAAAGVLAVAFRGRKDMATPLAAMLCGTAANAGAALLLVGPMGIAGLALAVSAGQTVVALVLGLRFLRWARA